MYIFSLSLTVATAGLGLVNPFLIGRIVGEVVEGGDTEALAGFLILMISVTLVRSALSYSFKYMLERVSQRVIYNIRQDVFKRVEDQSFKYFDSNRVGDIMARMTGDLQAVQHFVSTTVYWLTENVITFIVAIILMFTINWLLTLIMLAFAPVIAFLAIKQGKTIRPVFVRIREQFSVLNTVCQENISGNRVVKAFTREKHEIKKFTKENEAYRDANVDATGVWAKFLPVQEFIAGFLAVINLLVGGIMVVNGSMGLAELITINSLLWAINGPMRIMGWLVNDVQRFFASLDKVLGMLGAKIDIVNPANPAAKDKIKGDVEFRHVSFSFEDESGDKKNQVLKDISFKVKAGQTVGIAGPTGAGKTTMMNLLCRFYDVTGGEILVDGKDVRYYDLNNLRGHIASSMQDVFLFSDTIEGNIAYGVPDTPMDTVISAAETASAAGFIAETPEGYDTIVGERGVGLSGGQKQRLSLARAIAVNPSILILDDTTSAVDMETEHDIQSALDEKYGGITKFIIAHRISSLRHADLILVIVDGKVIERGTHDQLLKAGGYYKGLFDAQYGEYEQILPLLGQV